MGHSVLRVLLGLNPPSRKAVIGPVACEQTFLEGRLFISPPVFQA